MIAAELRGGNKPSLNEALGWIGSRVDDIYGTSVGRLEDVWIDPGTGVPRWLLVKEGRFGGRTTLIPFEDATAGAGHVWVPYEREIVRGAPEIEPGAPLTHQVEAALRNHYAANAPPAISHRVEPAPPIGRQPGSAMGTATLRMHGPPEAGPPSAFEFESAPSPEPPPPRSVPQPRRQVLREQARPGSAPPQSPPPFPPMHLPARPAPPVAAPPYQPQAPQLPVQPPQERIYRPEAPPRASAQAPYAPPPGMPHERAWEVQRPTPEAQPAYGYEAQAQRGWQGAQAQAQRGWQGAQAPPQPGPPPHWQPPPEPPPAADAIASLQALANSPEVHYVEIELSGELSIRGELRSVRVVPRGRGPAPGR